MKTLLIPTLALVASNAYGAISIVADNVTNLTISSGLSTWDTTTFPPSSNANVYVDLDLDGVFGEVGIGENTANTQVDLNFTLNPISSGDVYHFGLEGFSGASDTGSISFTLTNSDSSTQVINISEGAVTSFSDSNGDLWEASFDFNKNAYGNVVFNGGTVPNTGANLQDHQGVLTFVAVPEPSSAVLLGIGGLALIMRRRK